MQRHEENAPHVSAHVNIHGAQYLYKAKTKDLERLIQNLSMLGSSHEYRDEILSNVSYSLTTALELTPMLNSEQTASFIKILFDLMSISYNIQVFDVKEENPKQINLFNQ